MEPVVIRWADSPYDTAHHYYYHDILDIENTRISDYSSDDYIGNPKMETVMIPLAEASANAAWLNILAGVVLGTNEKVSDYIGRHRPELLL